MSSNYTRSSSSRSFTGNENEGGLSYGYNLAFTRPWNNLFPDAQGNYPNNPTGQTFSTFELQNLAKVCRQYNITVISDEIYGLLQFEGEYESIANYYPEGSIITTGLSKWAGAGGWRLGAMIIPDNFKSLYETMKALASETFSAVSAPIQFAAVEAYSVDVATSNYQKASRYILEKIGMAKILCNICLF